MTRTRSLAEIEVTLNDYDDRDHVEVCAEGVTEPVRRGETLDFGVVSEAELDAADRYVAGVLSRLAMAAYPWVQYEAQAHGCRPRWYAPDPEVGGNPVSPGDACGLGGMGLVLADWQPALYLTVPRRASKLWLRHVRSWLAAISESEVVRP